jgi:hypothetical protein
MLSVVNKLIGHHNQAADPAVMGRFEKLKSKMVSNTDEMKKANLIDKIRPSQNRYQEEHELHEQIRLHYQEILLESCTAERKERKAAFWDGNWGV